MNEILTGILISKPSQVAESNPFWDNLQVDFNLADVHKFSSGLYITLSVQTSLKDLAINWID